jgi:hypothetical protein
MVKIFVFLELEQKSAFFKGLIVPLESPQILCPKILSQIIIRESRGKRG